MEKYILCIAVIFTLILTSCEDVLKEEPKAIAVSTYYNTAEEIEKGVNAVYSPYQSYIGLFLFQVVSSFSDLTIGRGSYSQDFQLLSSTNITRTSNMWQYWYLSIRNANLIIKNAPNGTNISTADIEKYMAEAKFMRALGYFYLVRLWGGVPVRTEDNMMDSNIPRGTVDEVYQLIISDLENAEKNLPDELEEVGRPSKWAAKTVLADVYFYRGLNTEAAAKAKEVINSGKYSLIEVEKWEDFDSKLFGTNMVGSPESIFSVMYTKSGTSCQTSYFIFLNHAKSSYSGGRGDYVVRVDTLINSVYQKWDNADIRKDLLYWWDCSFGTGTYLSRKFIDPNANGGLSGHDHPIYRYADLLLLYAEASCLASGSPTAEGLEALNQVHRRAYGKNPVTNTSDVDFKLTDYNKDSFIELVIQERGYEDIFEARRWFDLKRSGKAKKYILENRGCNMSDNFLLWPIPDSEIEYNNAIDATDNQNPGY